MDKVQELLIEQQCAALSTKFANSVDRGDADALAGLFTKDGVFQRAGQELAGVEKIREFVGRRSQSRITRHVCTNIDVSVLGESEAIGVTYFLLFDGVTNAGAEEVVALDSPAVLGEYHDTFVLTPEGWRIKARRAQAIFRRQERSS